MAIIAHPPAGNERRTRGEGLRGGLWTCVAIGTIVGLTAALAAFLVNGFLTFP